MRQNPATALARRVTVPRRSSCCQRWDGWMKARYQSIEAAQATGDPRGLRAYECRVQPGTYHLTSKGTGK